ncbi:hypothetical protein HZS_757 [Henneguya salminicola]|nr:hypothetical protein HZS_757 [Henneguya salminicola]
MRSKFLLAVLIVCAIWFITIFKLNSILHHELYGPPVRVHDNLFVKIDYFNKYYRNSIDEDDNNHNGKYGEKVEILPEEQKEKDKGFNLHKFNELASSKIPMLRKLVDKRRNSCFTRKYQFNLPTASVIIIYHNEAFSTLLRTVHTVLSRSPYHLIKEIILVDDLSDPTVFPHLFSPLDEHFKDNKKINIIRPRKRIGLTVARLEGAKKATGDVLIFLDSHCEAFDGWLEPLLSDIKDNPTYAITPVIEIIDLEDFSISSHKVNIISVGTFTWKGDFNWFTPQNQDSSSNLIKSPTMAGGLFAIGRKYFFEVGSYDEKMTYWGGENIEISFRLWMCHGGIYIDPCSIVGHVFRKNSPHDLGHNSVLYNKYRAIEVWMDDFKYIVYSRMGTKKYDTRAGSLEERIKLRKNLGCHSFEWYLKNIAKELRIPGKSTSIRNPKSDKCFDGVDNKNSGKPIKLHKCHNQGGNQAFEVEKKGSIIFEELCLDLASSKNGSKPTMYSCHNLGGNQKWLFVEGDLIKSEIHDLCIKIEPNKIHLIASNCDIDDPFQKFKFTFSD